MKKLFIALVAIASFASCKKENVDTAIVAQEPAFTKSIKTSTNVYAGGTETYTYSFDAQGRMTSQIQDNAGVARTSTFDYTTAGKMFAIETDNGVLQSTYDCTINEKGYITAMTKKRANGALYYNYKYTYDANGYMIKYEWTNSAGITDHVEYIVENGNITEAKLFYNGVLNNTTKYGYDLTKYNCFNLNIAGYWYGKGFGKFNKNLFTNIKVTDPNGLVTWNANYTYQFDAGGYVAKRTYSNSVNNATGETTYTFQ